MPFWKIAAQVLLVIWNMFFTWEITELDCFGDRPEYCIKKIRRETQGEAKQSYEYLQTKCPKLS